MKLVDTVAIIGYLNPKDKTHKRSVEHISRVASDGEVFVPMASLVEADLVMKIKGYTYSEREISWRALERKIPPSKIVTNFVSSIYHALGLQEEGMDYFDSLISSLAQETNSVVITTDKVIEAAVKTEW